MFIYVPGQPYSCDKAFDCWPVAHCCPKLNSCACLLLEHAERGPAAPHTSSSWLVPPPGYTGLLTLPGIWCNTASLPQGSCCLWRGTNCHSTLGLGVCVCVRVWMRVCVCICVCGSNVAFFTLCIEPNLVWYSSSRHLLLVAWYQLPQCTGPRCVCVWVECNFLHAMHRT